MPADHEGAADDTVYLETTLLTTSTNITINGHTPYTLVDGGCSHNVIAVAWAAAHGIVPEDAKSLTSLQFADKSTRVERLCKATKVPVTLLGRDGEACRLFIGKVGLSKA